MVRLATPPNELPASAAEVAPAAPAPSPAAAISFDPTFETTLKRWVAEAVSEHIAKITEVAAKRALTSLERPSRVYSNHTSIRDLPLPTRIANGLGRIGVRTLGELTALHAEDILSSPNLGARSLDQLRHVLGLIGRSLSESRSARV